MSAQHPRTTEERRDYAAELYASAFYNALGHGMSEDEADAYANKRVANSIHLKTRWTASWRRS
jgi:hypothetical protein